jgi:hypothetical protein
MLNITCFSDKAKTYNLNLTSQRGERAYAKLVAQNEREFYIREGSKLEIEIGREKRQDDYNYFSLSDSNTLSKKHAIIFWDFEKMGFYIKNLSKNKVSNKQPNSMQIQIDSTDLASNQDPIRLENMTCLTIAKIRLYFLLPLDVTP